MTEGESRQQLMMRKGSHCPNEQLVNELLVTEKKKKKKPYCFKLSPLLSLFKA